MPNLAHIADAFEPDRVYLLPVLRVSAASFDYRDENLVYRIHAAYDDERVFSASVAVPVRRLSAGDGWDASGISD